MGATGFQLPWDPRGERKGLAMPLLNSQPDLVLQEAVCALDHNTDLMLARRQVQKPRQKVVVDLRATTNRHCSWGA